MKAVIMAGGKGTRIAQLGKDIPKPMMPILGKPILEYEIEALRQQGITEILLVIGHLGDAISSYFGDGTGMSPATGKVFGVTISYLREREPLGTAGALLLLKEELKKESDFLLLNGDILFDIDFERFMHFHKKQKGLVSLFTHPNNHPYDSGVISADENGRVTGWMHREEQEALSNEGGEHKWFQNRVNAGVHILSSQLFQISEKLIGKPRKLDLDRDILEPLIPTGQVFAYDSPEYVKDMGTPDRYQAVTEDIQEHKPQKRNLRHPQKAIFLDRDGTINQYVGFLRDSSELELLPGAALGIREINKSDYLAIVVTNQPVIARGEVTWEELGQIHNKMETLLGREGAYVDAIYICPHHPQKGFPGEREEYKISCDCRKPKPGLLLQAARDYHIDLSQSWIIGDRQTDLQAGEAAGCQGIWEGSLQKSVEKILHMAVGHAKS
jgi:D-glycero-D-manno-heptose 1,7-bisphosphate phosphatase